MYVCEACGGSFAAFRTAGQCPCCGVWAGVRCCSCRHTAPASVFINNGNCCPKCGQHVPIPGGAGSPAELSGAAVAALLGPLLLFGSIGYGIYYMATHADGGRPAAPTAAQKPSSSFAPAIDPQAALTQNDELAAEDFGAIASADVDSSGVVEGQDSTSIASQQDKQSVSGPKAFRLAVSPVQITSTEGDAFDPAPHAVSTLAAAMKALDHPEWEQTQVSGLKPITGFATPAPASLSPAPPAASVSPVPSTFDWHTFYDSTGQFSIEARFVSLTDTQVTLQKRDGSKIKIDLNRLSKESKEWINK